MSRRLTGALSGLALLTFVIIWAAVHYGFIYIGERGFDIIDMVQRPIYVPVGDAAHIHMTLNMIYGDLQLESGPVGLLTGSTRYNVAEFAPRVVYEEDGDRGQLLMDHFHGVDSTRLINREGRINTWNLILTDHLSIEELEVVVLLGSGNLDLRGLHLRHGSLALIAGDFTVDLRGNWEQSSVVQITGVTGEIQVLLPDEVSTLVILDNAARTLNVAGLAKLADPPTPTSLPAALMQQRDFLDRNEAGDEETNNRVEEWEDYTFYANPGYKEGAVTLYVQVADAFGTLSLIAESP
jgi:hypothetical protein